MEIKFNVQDEKSESPFSTLTAFLSSDIAVPCVRSFIKEVHFIERKISKIDGSLKIVRLWDHLFIDITTFVQKKCHKENISSKDYLKIKRLQYGIEDKAFKVWAEHYRVKIS